MEIQGHYENGVIIPDGSISLPDGTAVTIIVGTPNQTTEGTMSDEKRKIYLAGLGQIDAVPNENGGDSFGGAEHDRVLYGHES
jgi:hypothetical protein